MRQINSTFVDESSVIPSTFLNQLQDEALGQQEANSNNDLAGDPGVDVLIWQAATGIDPGSNRTRLVDDRIDWRDRVIWGIAEVTLTSANRIGQSNDQSWATYQDEAFHWSGYTGTGAYSNISTGAAVAHGSPPVRGASTYRSYFVELRDALDVASGAPLYEGLYAYVDPSTGYLYLYNAHASSVVYPSLFIFATGQTGKRS